MSLWFSFDRADFLAAYQRACAIARSMHKINNKPTFVQNKKDTKDIKEILMKYYSPDIHKHSLPVAREAPGDGEAKECFVCYSEFSDANRPYKLRACSHPSECCRSCLREYILCRIHSHDIFPCLTCPAPSCRRAIEMDDLCSPLLDITLPVLVEMAIRAMKPLLMRNKNWRACCSTDSKQQRDNEREEKAAAADRGDVLAFNAADCQFGFLLDSSSVVGLACPVCRAVQRADRAAVVWDSELERLVSSGVLKACPACGELQGKDYGLCNVIQCPHCKIWWNYQTKETGSNQTELKQRARMSRSLWGPGELQYQQRLEREDPEAFKALLQRNGIQYNPNYVRGLG